MEIGQIECFKLLTIPNRHYDPLNLANNFTNQVKIRPFVHEDDDFDDLFEWVDNYVAVQKLETLCLHPQQLLKFQQYKNKRLQKIPLNILNVSQTMAQKESESVIKDTKVLNTTDHEKIIEVQIIDLYFPSNIKDVWKEFDLKLQE